ncbi:NAD kinase [Pararhizobium sp. IMCC21322]|uniref:NAD kinase n=1 Tax=Pararhizobium sp. IMCC21322 TaxID=3067903 RepID=UPI002740B525|nr:NAD kinase [Pararhizobium sp. IMCC21322]
MKFAFEASDADGAQEALTELQKHYKSVPPEEADVIVVLGGDGSMLKALHTYMNSGKMLYGLNRGSIGFLMNEFAAEKLDERIEKAVSTFINPLVMEVTLPGGEVERAYALNEVSLLRQSYQAAKLQISVDERIRLPELICDGILLATPQGSTAYNLSAHGPILPINAPLLALTPISPFRPRRWRGALLPNRAKLTIDVLDPARRPVNAVADHTEFKSVKRVVAWEDNTSRCGILFDPDHSWDERILAEQFQY